MKIGYIVLVIILVLMIIAGVLYNAPHPHLMRESISNYSIAITIDSSKINEDLTNFTLVVWLNNSNFDFDRAQPNGEDIIFVDSNNKTLPFHNETYNSTDAYFWVRIPFINSTLNTTFYLCSNLGQQDNEGTWDDRYIMVNHFNDDPSKIMVDSSGNGHNFKGINFKSTDLVTGQIGGAVSSSDKGKYAVSNAYIPSYLDEFTWVLWAYSRDIEISSREQYLLYQLQSKGYGGIYFDHHTTTAQKTGKTPNYKFAVGTGFENSSVTHLVYYPLKKNEWNFLVGTATRNGDWYFYVDGIQADVNNSNLPFGDSTSVIYLFKGFDMFTYFNGTLDAFRYLDYAVSPAWVNATYYSETFRLLSFNELKGNLASCGGGFKENG